MHSSTRDDFFPDAAARIRARLKEHRRDTADRSRLTRGREPTAAAAVSLDADFTPFTRTAARTSRPAHGPGTHPAMRPVTPARSIAHLYTSLASSYNYRPRFSDDTVSNAPTRMRKDDSPEDRGGSLRASTTLASTPRTSGTSPNGVVWPITVSLHHCANRSSRELMEMLMRKYGWREASDTTATLLWTDQKVARGYKSFRNIAQTSAWFKEGTQRSQQSRPAAASPLSLTQDTRGAPPAHERPCEFFPDRSAVRYTNHYPDMHHVVTKSNLAHALSWYQRLFPQDYDFFPRHFDLGLAADTRAFQELLEAQRHSSRPKTYILKPAASRQGEGIALAQRWSEVAAILNAQKGRHFVASRYIDSPMLLDGFKFDFRVYVLVSSLQPFTAYVFRDGLARLATMKYHPPTEANIAESLLHLTNYSLNKANPEFQPNQEKGEWNDFPSFELQELSDNIASKRSIRTALHQLRLAGVPINFDSFWNEVSGIVEKTLLAMWPSLQGAHLRHFPDRDNVDVITSHTIPASGRAPSLSPTAASRPTTAAAGRTSRPMTATRSAQPVTRDVAESPSLSPTSSDAPSSDDDFEQFSRSSGTNRVCSYGANVSSSASSIASSPRMASFKRVFGAHRPLPLEMSETSCEQTSHPMPLDADRTPATSSNASPASFFPLPSPPSALLQPSAPAHCFHLLGFDILMDSDLKCWLLEVNAAPSMNLDSSLDKRIKLAVLERSLELLGLIPPASAMRTSSMPLFDPTRDRSDEADSDVEPEAEEIEAGRPRSAYTSNVIAQPTRYKTVDYVNHSHSTSFALEENEKKHTRVLKKTRNTFFPSVAAALQRMFLTFTAKRYSSGLSIGAWSRLLHNYGLAQRPSAMSSPSNRASANHSSAPPSGESDLIFMRILRKSNERVMSFASFCQAMIEVAIMRHPHAPTPIEAFTLLLHEVDRRQTLALERVAAKRISRVEQGTSRHRSASPTSSPQFGSSPLPTGAVDNRRPLTGSRSRAASASLHRVSLQVSALKAAHTAAAGITHRPPSHASTGRTFTDDGGRSFHTSTPLSTSPTPVSLLQRRLASTRMEAPRNKATHAPPTFALWTPSFR